MRRVKPVRLQNALKSNSYNAYKIGDIAQMGERLNGIQEVKGSIPFISTPKLLISRGKFKFPS